MRSLSQGTAMGKHFDEALKRLASDEIEETQGIIDSINEAITELEEDRDLIEEMIDRKRGPAPKAKPKQPELPLQKPRLIIRKRIPSGMDRSTFIKRQAVEVAKGQNGKVTVDQMKEALKGYALGTNIPGTVIANVLFKAAPEWKRLDPGIYQYVGAQ